MRIPLLLACCVLALAAEDARVQAKAAWLAAGKAGDAWTCLQLEAWAREQKPALRLGSALGESALVGDPLFAFPARVDTLADRGERIVVCAGGRAWVLAPDGRPLQPSVRLGEGGSHAIGYDGEAVLTATTADDGSWRLNAVRLGDGSRVLAATYRPEPAQSRDDMAVADDGSAAAVEVETEDGATGRTIRSILLAVGERPPRLLDIPAVPVGVGRAGAWLVAGYAPHCFVQCGERRSPAVAAVGGPGLAAFIAGGKAALVLADGKQALLQGGPAIGEEPGLAAVGGWLVMFSGRGAKTVSQGDLLGEGAGGEAVQPPTLAFWRWTDLAADPAAKPVASLPGELSVASDQPASLWRWEGRRLERIDLTGDQPKVVPQFESAHEIRWASSSIHCIRLDHAQGHRSLYGPEGKELWYGPAHDLDIVRRDLVLVERVQEGRYSWALATLAPEPAKRKEVRLQIPEQEQSIRVSRRPPDLLVARGERNWWRSVGFDGKVIETAREAGPAAQPPPAVQPWVWYCPSGRFYHDGARVLAKAASPATDPLSGIELADAWRIGGGTILLDVGGRVVVGGRKRGEWLDLPAVAGGDRLALAKDVPVLVAGDEPRMVAALIPGPRLEPHDGGIASELPGGPWRIERRWRFTPPRGRQLEWDGERLGWWPVRLRSPEGGGLFIITPAVLIELDPAAARMFGR